MFITKRTFKIAFFCLLTNFFTSNAAIKHHNKIHFSTIEQDSFTQTFTVYDLHKMQVVKTKLQTKQFKASYDALIKNAEKALTDGVYTVMQKTEVAPSGDKHDYISYGPYWWPDPKKTDGLPWIRRDGEINPLTRGNTTDYEAKNKAFSNINELALAYFFSDNKQYANKAIALLNSWFVNEDTKMNPNLNFAQAIPGENTGRGFGIIELSSITNIITAIEILELNGEMDNETSQNLRQWCTQYLNWLQTSEPGIFEKNTKNNHGVYYDVQVVSLLIFLNRIDEAKQVLEEVKTIRIETQITPDGKQPHELARTKALSYSTMNLRGYTLLAFFGKNIGVDLWNYQAENGGSIQKAYEFLMPYAKNEKVWEYQQINSLDKAKKSLKQLFIEAGSRFDNQNYCEIGKYNKSDKENSLLYYCQ